MNIEKVTVFGTGNFGARLAFHIAFNQVDVTVYDLNYGLLEEARTRFREFGNEYREQFGASPEKVEAALANVAYSMEIAEAAGNAQLIIEAVVEDLEIKKTFFKELKKTAPKNAIFATTSQDLDLEKLAETAGRPEKFLNLHFTENEEGQNTLEIVGLPATHAETRKNVVRFFENMGMITTDKNLNEQN